MRQSPYTVGAAFDPSNHYGAAVVTGAYVELYRVFAFRWMEMGLMPDMKEARRVVRRLVGRELAITEGDVCSTI